VARRNLLRRSRLDDGHRIAIIAPTSSLPRGAPNAAIAIRAPGHYNLSVPHPDVAR